ncbi:MAG: M6 family metalloprotease domain-containing protein [Clostridiaceae bacterium]
MGKIDKLMLSIVTAFSIIILKSTTVLAAPIYDVPVKLIQKDGQVINCYISGDEYTHYYHDINKNIIMKDSLGRIVYAKNIDGVPVPSEVAVNSGLKKPDNIAKLSDIKISEAAVKEKLEPKDDGRKSFSSSSISSSDQGITKGVLNNLVIFIKFKDDTEFSTPLSYYSGVYNSNSISMKNYFSEVSYNKLTLNSSFYPATSSDNILSYTDSYDRSYYQPYGWDNPYGYTTYDEGYKREQVLLRNAILSVSSQVPTTLNLDNNSDGLIDSISFVAKGGSNQWGNVLWPHSWAMLNHYVDDIYINGKKAYSFDFHLEDFIKSKGIGVLAHEMFHTLGAPDLYHYNQLYYNISPVGKWDLMEETTRQHMGAYMKYKYGKWIDNIPEITKGDYVLNPLTSQSNNVYKISIPGNDKEFFIVEYRKQTGNYESQLPGSGLLVYRINLNSEGKGNAYGPPDEVYIFRPGGTTNTNGYINSANFSNKVGRGSLVGVINLFDSVGNRINISINNIVEYSNSIAFSVVTPEISMESSHPYNNDEDKTWSVDAPSNVEKVNLTFDSLTEVESGNDFIYITDKNGKNITGSPFTGKALAGKTITVNGNKAKIRVKSNSDISKYGFKISNIKYDYIYTGYFLSNVQGNTLNINGFGIYKANISKFDIYIDNVYYGSGKRFSRNDFSKTYPYTDLSQSGFSYSIDTRLLKNGTHNITVVAVGSDGTKRSFGTKSVNINDAKLGFISSLDKFQKVNSSTVSIGGWAAYGKYISKVEILVDGIVKGQATRLQRYDVSKAFPTYSTINSGFNYNLDISKLYAGNHNVTLRFSSVDGSVFNINKVLTK